MLGDAEVLQLLNEQLTSELTAINQYFLHSKMQDNWGYTELAAHTRAESFDEMKHAEALTDRILLLDGLPNYQRLFSVRIGQTVREQFEADLVWDSVGRVTDDGYIVEIRLPLQTIRFSGGSDVKMGILFFRKISRTGVSYSWPAMPPGQWVFDNPAHLFFRYFSAQCSQRLSNLGMLFDGGAPDERCSIVGRKVVLVVDEDNKTERADQTICRIACDEVDLAVRDCLIRERQIHHSGRTRKLKTVSFRQPRITIFTLDELVTEPCDPLTRMRGCIRDSLDVHAVRVGFPHNDREGVVETERLGPLNTKAGVIRGFDGVVYAGRIVYRRLLENRRQPGPCVFHIHVELAGYESLVTDERATEIQPAIDLEVRLAFDLLSEHLAEDDLLGEILGTHHDSFST